MIDVSIDTSDFMRTLSNIIGFDEGYIVTMMEQQKSLNMQIAQAVIAMLGDYIDSKASMNPYSLHHVYEPGMTGDPSARLFEFDMYAAGDGFIIMSKFLESRVPSENSTEPFVHRAEVMELGDPVFIAPKNGDILAFEDEGETVFTSQPVIVEHPGGTEVAGAFDAIVRQFFNSYVTYAVLKPIMAKLVDKSVFEAMYAEGARMGASAGRAAARKTIQGALDVTF